jgi:spore coat polysaccharide biosynthesis protein SpsF
MSPVEQRRAWRGEFGDAYTARNARTEESLASRVRFFTRVLGAVTLSSAPALLEIGCNVGMNLEALDRVRRPARLFGVDLNEHALHSLTGTPALAGRARVVAGEGQRLPFADGTVDLAFTCGVLIHVHPDDLLEVCREIVRVSRRYVLCAEYFSPRPEAIEYRGRMDLLFKRDFGGFYLDQWPELRLVDYGFLWKRTEFDDLNWWLFERTGGGR